MILTKKINGKCVISKDFIPFLQDFVSKNNDASLRTNFGIALPTLQNWLLYKTEVAPRANISDRGKRALENIWNAINSGAKRNPAGKQGFIDPELIATLSDDEFVRLVWVEARRRNLICTISS